MLAFLSPARPDNICRSCCCSVGDYICQWLYVMTSELRIK